MVGCGGSCAGREDEELDNSLFAWLLEIRPVGGGESGRAVKDLERMFRGSIAFTSARSSSMVWKEFLSAIRKPPSGEAGSTMMVVSSIAEDGGVSRESWVAVLERDLRPEDLEEIDLAGGLSGERRGLSGGAPEEVWFAVFESERAV